MHHFWDVGKRVYLKTISTTYNLVTNRVDVVRCVKDRELMRKKLAHAEEDEGADSHQVVQLRVVHHGGDLPLLVPLNIHAPIDAQGRQLVVLVVLRHMGWAVRRLDIK